MLLYVAIICLAGGSFSFWLVGDSSRRFIQRNLLYVGIGAFVGFNAVIFYFLLQVGAINDRGVAGIYDWDVISFLLQTPVGDSSLIRSGAFLLALLVQVTALTHIARRHKPPTQRFFALLLSCNAIFLLILAFSFGQSGHVATLSMLAQAAVLLHVLAMALWIGSLFPLLLVTRELDAAAARVILERFSRVGLITVAILLLSALTMAIELLASPAELLNSSYGIALLIKMLLVSGLLLLAALNKFRLLPQLSQPAGLLNLDRSIRGEMALAVLVVAVTAVLSTVVGPASH